MARTPSSEPPDRAAYDPQLPVMTVGGSTCCGEEVTPISIGPHDQQPIEWRPDVLVYTSPPLEENIEVTGPVTLVLYAASTAHDTDFTAKLVDVRPNGTAINVAQGIIRARYRDSWEEPSLLAPGKVYKYTIDLWSTGNCFLKGHRVRVDVSSSNFPQFDRNPNTGAPFGLDAETLWRTRSPTRCRASVAHPAAGRSGRWLASIAEDAMCLATRRFLDSVPWRRVHSIRLLEKGTSR